MALLALLAVQVPARADIGLLLNASPNAPVELSVGQITGEGHSAVYFSRVCAASPVELRLCRPGENGAILQSYENYKEDQPFEWNIVPLSVYLYGVDDAADEPLFASPEIRAVLQERYRLNHLSRICTTPACISDPKANWRDAVAAAFVREIYIFKVRTTVEQDEQFIRDFNARANVNHYNGFLRNCADFSKLVVNTYFPHSAHRDVINDFGMTGPKAIARSFSHYAERHPELGFRVIRIDQLPGTYKRSGDCREGTEQVFRSKKWLVPVAIVHAQALPVLAASYLLTGRFDPNRELAKHPSADAAALSEQLAEAKRGGDRLRRKELKRQLQEERESELGTPEQWQTYRSRFEEVVRTAIADGALADQKELGTIFADVQRGGRAYLDGEGQPWLEVATDGGLRHVGLSATNIFSAGSDPDLARRVLLARTSYLLSANAKHRELMPAFQADWHLLQRAEDTATGPQPSAVAATQVSGQE